ncbi:MAG: 3-phosphoserine/phosphohydroxythreonine transaminase, partial [Candidatus Portiera sp.]|nr:3-phosphoserine/phosphohydroxythreonine transaminase [Portiera sp.]
SLPMFYELDKRGNIILARATKIQATPSKQSKWLTATEMLRSYKGAELKGAELKRAELKGAELKGAELKGAELKGAELKRAELRETNKTRAAYIHCCLNETIDGTRLPKLPPAVGIPLVADVSSCIAAYPLDFAKLDIAYACAQKNLGIAGLTLVSINSKLLEVEPSPNLPHILSYQRQAKSDSLLNTPPTFSVYVCNLMCEWLEKQGGVGELAKINQRKAAAIYEQIDLSQGFYINNLQSKFRSLTNVVFDLPNKKLENEFLTEAATKGLMNLRGHSAGAGAIRASIYNAISESDTMRLCDFMSKWRRKHKVETQKQKLETQT